MKREKKVHAATGKGAKHQIMEALKRVRKENREAEIKAHGKPLGRTKIVPSKKIYNRKRQKGESNG